MLFDWYGCLSLSKDIIKKIPGCYIAHRLYNFARSLGNKAVCTERKIKGTVSLQVVFIFHSIIHSEVAKANNKDPYIFIEFVGIVRCCL